MKINVNTVLLGIAVVMLAILLFGTCGKDKQVSTGDEIRGLDSVLNVFRYEQGVRYTLLQQRMSASDNSREMALLVEELKAMGIKMKNVEKMMKIGLSSSDTFLVDIEPVMDSMQMGMNHTNTGLAELSAKLDGLTKEYNIPFDNGNLSMNTNFNILTGKAIGKYTYKCDLTLVDNWKKRLFRPDRLLLTADINDPNATLAIQTFNIEPKKNLFDVSFIGGYGYGLYDGKVRPAPFVGLGISKKVFSVNVK